MSEEKKELTEEVLEKEVSVLEEQVGYAAEETCDFCDDCDETRGDCDFESEEEEEQEELSDEDRKKLIETYNEQNKGESWMDLEKPTREEIDAIAEEYRSKVEVFNAEKFTLADKENALRVAKFLKRWNDDYVCWNGEGWRGAIFFDAIVKQFIEECQKEEKDFVVDWQTLTYLFMYMRNGQGVGLKQAIKFAEIAEEFNRILDVVGDEFTKHNEGGEKMKRLQEKWQVYEAGFKVHYCDEEQQEEIEEDNE